jgi:hypothetical protein
VTLPLTLVLGLALSPLKIQGSSRLDRPYSGNFRVSNSDTGGCGMLELFDQVAREARIAIGFENAPGCWFGPRSVLKDGGHVLTARTAREAFDEVARLSRTFSWREIDGVVVIRPTSAWEDADSFLRLRVDAFQLLNVSLDEALYRALDAATPRLRFTRANRLLSSPFDVPMSVDFFGGSLLGALTTIIRAKGDAEWHVGYTNAGAAILISSLSRLDSSATAFVPPIAWNLEVRTKN